MNSDHFKNRGMLLACEPLRVRALISFCVFGGKYDAKVAAGASAYFVARPQVAFRPHRLVIAPSCAPFFDLLDFRVGKNSQRAEGSPVSCEFFPPLPCDVKPAGDAARFFGVEGASAELFPNLPMSEAEREAMRHFERGAGGDTCHSGCDMSLLVRNKTEDAPREFEAIVWGVFADEF